VSQAIGAHDDPKELFRVLADELHRVVQFDFIGVSLRDKNSDTFQNYFIDMTSRSELVPDENPRGDGYVVGLRAARTSSEVDQRNGALLWPAASDVEEALYSLDLRTALDDSAPQTGSNHFR
jgi:hypothetical protein